MRPEIKNILAEINQVIAGKKTVVEKLLMAILAEGHVLMDDVPGVGKTTLASAVSRVTGLVCRRVQFTPDVLPSDLTGFSMPDPKNGEFVYRPGVIAQCNLLLGDEINRASSKTQSALLEAMEEKQVTVDGVTHPVPAPFMVIATQNSVGAAGTEPLPYAQLDRFLVRLSMGYPDYGAQMDMLRQRQNNNPLEQIQRVLSKEELIAMQQEVRQVTSSDAVLDYITRLTLSSREASALALGISPRGALFLDRAAKAHAYMDGRDYVTGADVQSVFPDVCAHRIILKKQVREEGHTEESELRELLRKVEVPDHHRLNGMLKR